MEDIEKDHVPFMDEMEIVQAKEDDCSFNYLFGSTTLPNTLDTVANHALAFAVGGLNNATSKLWHITSQAGLLMHDY